MYYNANLMSLCTSYEKACCNNCVMYIST